MPPMCRAAKGQSPKGPVDRRVLASKSVRILAIVVAGLVTLVPGSVRADQREDLQQKGEQQAKDGRFAEAIDSFKAADRIAPRASHACLIALAYTRRELWSQAQLWLSKCHSRANASDPLPDWTPLAEKQITERLQTANVVEVTIEVSPGTATSPEITVSSFAPDETFAPRTIHLSPGTHVVFAKAEGFQPQQKTITLTDKKPQRVVIDLAPPTTAPTDGTILRSPPPEPPTDKPSNTASTVLMTAGGAGIVFGVVAHLVMAKRRKTLDDAPDLAGYRKAEGPYETWRAITIGSYGVGAALFVTGYLLRKSTPESAQVTALPLPEGGGVVSIGWTR